MILNHGTSYTRMADDIGIVGLKPRGSNKSNFFTQGVESNNNVVYLTDDKEGADFYQWRSCLANNDVVGVNVIVNTDDLEEDLLRIDENLIDIESRGTTKNCPISLRKEQAEIVNSDKRWKTSVEKTSLLSYKGVIPAKKFLDVQFKYIEENIFFDQEFLNIEDISKRLRCHDLFLQGRSIVNNIAKDNIIDDLLEYLSLFDIVSRKWVLKGIQNN